MGATPSLSLVFHPQSNRQTVRLTQDLEVALCCMVSRDLASWFCLLI